MKTANRFIALLIAISLLACVSAVAENEEKHDFRQVNWGYSKDDVKAAEGEPMYDSTSDEGIPYLFYSTTCNGLDAYLMYFFSDDGLYEGGYMMNESHTATSKYINDYDTLRESISKKYGEPLLDKASYDTTDHENYYSGGKESDALEYGFLDYYTYWTTDNTTILMHMWAEDYEVKTSVSFSSVTLSPEETDYSSDF